MVKVVVGGGRFSLGPNVKKPYSVDQKGKKMFINETEKVSCKSAFYTRDRQEIDR